jgi:hypothetical protein
MAIDCNNPHISQEELVNSLLVRTNLGVTGIRIKRVTAAAANIEPVIGCAEYNLGDEMILRYAIGLSTSGEPALIFIEEA